MPTISGLSKEGFLAKDFTTIKDEMEAELRKQLDPTLRFGPDTVAGMLTTIVANQAKQVWEAAYGLYHSLKPHAASGRSLDSLCSLTGTYRKQPAYSRATVVLSLDKKAKVAAGSLIKSIDGHMFATLTEVKNQLDIKTDVAADVRAQEPGTFIAHIGAPAAIMTPVAGWLKATFKETYEIGRLVETDDELRIRRMDELKASGSSTLGAIKARLGGLNNVEAVHIQERERSFEVIIKGGDEDEIARAIWQCKPIGIETSGSIVRTVIDSIKQERQVRFSRPEVVGFSLNITLKVGRLLTATEIDALKNALVDQGRTYFSLGSEVYPSRFYAVLLEQQHVLDVASLRFSALSKIAPHQIASLSFAGIDIQQQVEVAG